MNNTKRDCGKVDLESLKDNAFEVADLQRADLRLALELADVILAYDAGADRLTPYLGSLTWGDLLAGELDPGEVRVVVFRVDPATAERELLMTALVLSRGGHEVRLP